MNNRITVLSDLHLEHYADVNLAMSMTGTDIISGDILVLAGDIVQINRLPDYLPFFAKMAEAFNHVIYVPGNHEYYQLWSWSTHTSLKQGYDHLKDLLSHIPNLSVLDNECVKVCGILFYGATLWADITECLSPIHAKLIQRWPDFRLVPNPDGTGIQTAESMRVIHRESLAALKRFALDTLWSKDAGTEPIFFVTHFGPTTKFQDPQYVAEPFGQFFYTDLDTMIMPGGLLAHDRVKAWAFGHTHSSVDKQFHGLRIICNPAGYPQGPSFGLENQEFTATPTEFEIEV